MPHLSIKTGAIACALGLFALIGAANAASPIPVIGVAPIAIPVIDEGTAIEELERPNQVPPGSQEGATLNVAPQPGDRRPRDQCRRRRIAAGVPLRGVAAKHAQIGLLIYDECLERGRDPLRRDFALDRVGVFQFAEEFRPVWLRPGKREALSQTYI